MMSYEKMLQAMERANSAKLVLFSSPFGPRLYSIGWRTARCFEKGMLLGESRAPKIALL
jgi:hypothetical protein